MSEPVAVSLEPSTFVDDYTPEGDEFFQEEWHWRELADTPDWEVSPLVPVIEGIIGSENLVLIAAPTQNRKTLLGLYMLILLDRGGKLFGKYRIAGRHKVLYVVLEDPDRRIKDRRSIRF